MLCGYNKSRVYIPFDGYNILECRGCGLLYSDIVLTKDQLEKYYNDYDFSYLLKYKEQSIDKAKRILKKINKYSLKGTLLDIGSGCGFLLNTAKEEGWDTTGIELSKDACEYSRKYFGLQVFDCDVRDAHLKDNSFDLITMHHVFEHLPEPLAILSDLKRKLKDTGILVIVVPNTRSVVATLAGKNWVGLAEMTHLFHYNRNTLKMILVKAGFEVFEEYSLQYNAMELLWAVKIFLSGRKSVSVNNTILETARGLELKPVMQNSCGVKRLINKLAHPLGTLVDKLGLGAELVVLTRKGR